MPIPEFQTLMLPLLKFAADNQLHSMAETRVWLAAHFGLSDAELEEMLPSGRQRRFNNRVAWARVYLSLAGLLCAQKRAHYKITEAGQNLLAERPARINITLLNRYEQFRESRKAKKEDGPDDAGRGKDQTPEETLEQAYQSIRAELARELLEHIKGASPQFFETLVVDLLLKMGYGRNRAEAGKSIGKTGDEGIDGIISEDRLGLDLIYIQAKRWEGTVGRPEVQKFVGALHGKMARKGVFITTGTFSQEAKAYAAHMDPRIVLIDGQQVAEYMIDLDLGVAAKVCYEIKRIDTDYFEE